MRDNPPGSATRRAQEKLGTSMWEWLEEFKTYAIFYGEMLGRDEVFGEVVDWSVALPLTYNRRAYPAVDGLPRVEHGMVFRALRPEEHPDRGLEPKLPDLYGKKHEEYLPNLGKINVRGKFTMTLDQHIQSGSDLAESLYISTSRCPLAALFYAMKSYVGRHHEPDELKVAGVDLGPMSGIGGVREHAYIYDMSRLALRQAYLETEKARNYGRKFEEVLLQGVVPPGAVTGCISLSTICALVRDPQLLERLRTPVCSGFDSFRDACSGAVDNAMRRHFGLPIAASVQPERTLSNIPVRAQRPIPARYEQACRMCERWISQGDPIVNAPPRGWVHASCAGGQIAPLRQPTRRGGMHARLSSRAAAIARDALSGSSDLESIPNTHDSWL